MSPHSDAIRVAISGGGIAGAALIRALMRHKQLDVHIFESAPAFKEMGLAVGMTRNAFEALGLMDATACLERAGAVIHHGIRFMLAQGPDAGRMADEIDSALDGRHLTHIVHRADFLRELLAEIPRARMHTSKRLMTAAHKAEGGLELGFADGSTHDCDVLIGADGSHSSVRKIILGEADPAASPVFAGWYGRATLRPYAEMRALLGSSFVDLKDSREWAWLGDGAFMMHNVSNDGQYVQFIWNIKADEPQTSWRRTTEVAEIRDAFRGWPLHLLNALDVVLGDEQKVDCHNMREHLPAQTYVDGPICIIGDAAHTTTPWQASGGGTSVEDALILSTLLGQSSSPSQALIALQVYDQVRRPRTLNVVESSRQTGLAFTGRNPSYPLTIDGLKDRFRHRWDFILDFDNAQARDEAFRIFQSKSHAE